MPPRGLEAATIERRSPLSGSRRYYPGFFAALFLVLLRTAIGWHFLYEGMEKLHPPVGKPFTAEGYLRASAGPFAAFFRNHIPDADGLQRLKFDEKGHPIGLEDRWRIDLSRYAAHYGLTDTQRKEAETSMTLIAEEAQDWYRGADNREKVRKYLHDIAAVRSVESNPKALAYQLNRAWKDRRELDTARKELVGLADSWTSRLQEKWGDILTPQQKALTPIEPPKSDLDRVNTVTMWLLVLAGGGMLLGLFSRFSALAAASFLLMTYLTLPPWPGLPAPPNAEGHYLFVNKNLIEMLACLALAFLPTGQWIGLDALLFGWFSRRREARREAAELDAGDGRLRHDMDYNRLGTLTRRV